MLKILDNTIGFVGWIILLVFMVIAGDPRDNRFGPDPKAVSPAF